MNYLVEKLSCHFKVSFYEEDNYIFPDGYQFVITYNGERNFSIYRQFSYPIYDGYESISDVVYEELLFLQSFYQESKQKPKLDYECSMGCCYDEEMAGFFNLESEEELFEFVKYFIKVEPTHVNLDISLLMNLYPEKTMQYVEECKKEQERLLYLYDLGWKDFHMSKGNSVYEKGQVLMNERGTVLVGMGGIEFEQLINTLKIMDYKENEYLHIGLKYTIVKNEFSTIVCDTKLIEEVRRHIEHLNFFNYDELIFYISDTEIIIAKCSCYWAIVMPIKMKVQDAIKFEKKNLAEKMNNLELIDPEKYVEKENLDFTKITASQFEELCKVILSVLGFKHIISRGHTNSPDGGVDIECDEEINQIFGVKVRHWIFQCKNAKKVNRKDIGEIPLLLKECNAEGYGLFYTGKFTAQTLERLKGMDNDEKNEIQYWDGFMLSEIIRENLRIKKAFSELIEINQSRT